MTAEELWKKAGLSGSYEAWSFGGDPDRLAALVTTGIKTATSSAYDLYAIDDEPLPRVGDYSVVLNSAEEAVCIIRTTAVYIVCPLTVSVPAMLFWKVKATARWHTGRAYTVLFSQVKCLLQACCSVNRCRSFVKSLPSFCEQRTHNRNFSCFPCILCSSFFVPLQPKPPKKREFSVNFTPFCSCQGL